MTINGILHFTYFPFFSSSAEVFINYFQQLENPLAKCFFKLLSEINSSPKMFLNTPPSISFRLLVSINVCLHFQFHLMWGQHDITFVLVMDHTNETAWKWGKKLKARAEQ